ncbi:MAG: DUF5615 family PIN-like protein [Anaerolineae bacterium]|nr:DUF5615 family PIN-like protein [Anaerolineae bacterium]
MNAFKLLADENIAVAVIDELISRDVDISRVRDVISEDTPDPDLLEYAHANGYALLTHDQKITGHIAARHRKGKGHAGLFIAGKHLQGEHGIGTIVTSILEYRALIAAGAGTVQDDVDNLVNYI